MIKRIAAALLIRMTVGAAVAVGFPAQPDSASLGCQQADTIAIPQPDENTIAVESASTKCAEITVGDRADSSKSGGSGWAHFWRALDANVDHLSSWVLIVATIIWAPGSWYVKRWHRLHNRDLPNDDERMLASILLRCQELAAKKDEEALTKFISEQNEEVLRGSSGAEFGVPWLEKEWGHIAGEAADLGSPLESFSRQEIAERIRKIETLTKQALKKLQSKVKISRDPLNV